MSIVALVLSVVSVGISAGALWISFHAHRHTLEEGARRRAAASWVIETFHAADAADAGNRIPWASLDDQQRDLAITAVTMGLLSFDLFGGMLLALPARAESP